MAFSRSALFLGGKSDIDKVIELVPSVINVYPTSGNVLLAWIVIESTENVRLLNKVVTSTSSPIIRQTGGFPLANSQNSIRHPRVNNPKPA